MRSTSSATDSVYLDCREEIWQAESDITGKFIAGSAAEFPSTRVAKEIIDAVKKRSPPFVYTG